MGLSSRRGDENETLNDDGKGESIIDTVVDFPAAETSPARNAAEYEADSRPKKLTGIQAIRENMKEFHEVVAYMDYSFERAFTFKEKEYMLAYKVRTEEAALLTRFKFVTVPLAANSSGHQRTESGPG